MPTNNLQGLPADTAMCPCPIFIIGSPRSGTTILAYSLAQHSELWSSAESDILYYLFGDGLVDRAFTKAKAGPGIRWLHQEGVEKEEFLGFLGLGLNALFSSRSQGKRWVDQTPLYTLMVDTLAAMFPGALFIHMLRDGRRVVNSMLNFLHPADAQKGANIQDRDLIGSWTTDFTQACRTWRHHVEISLDFQRRHPERCLTITNEALVEDPKVGFRQILAFLGASEEDEPANHFASNRINSSFRPNSSDPSWVRQLSQPWIPWTAEQKDIFAREAGETLIGCGFATADDLTLSEYEEMVLEISKVAAAELPSDAKVLVATKGDPQLLQLEGREAAHFPRHESGDYAGGNFADAGEAVAQLEALRALGFDHLLLPRSAFWWLDYYGGLQAYLDVNSAQVHSGADCVIYRLSSEPEGATRRPDLASQNRWPKKVLPEQLNKKEVTARYTELFKRRDLGNRFESLIQRIYEGVLHSGMNAIDGGANIGDHTIPMARAAGPAGRVHAFEPIPQLVKHVRERAQREGVSDIALLHEAAISNYEGDASYVLATDQQGSMAMSGLLERVFPAGMEMKMQEISVIVTTLDRAVPPDSVISFIKLDLEGGEFHSLLGAERILTVDRPVIVFENARGQSAEKYGYTSESFFEFFRLKGYILTDLLGVEFRPEFWDCRQLPWYSLAVPKERGWDDIAEAINREVRCSFPEIQRLWMATSQVTVP